MTNLLWRIKHWLKYQPIIIVCTIVSKVFGFIAWIIDKGGYILFGKERWERAKEEQEEIDRYNEYMKRYACPVCGEILYYIYEDMDNWGPEGSGKPVEIHDHYIIIYCPKNDGGILEIDDSDI